MVKEKKIKRLDIGKPYLIPENIRSQYEVYTPDEPFETEKNIPGYESKITYLRRKQESQKNPL